MAKGDSLYARLEVAFVRGPEFQSLCPGERVLYLNLWCYALEQRRQIIKRPPPDFLARLAALKHHHIGTYLEHMANIGLTVMTDEFIDMVGLREKHSKLKNWKTPYEMLSDPKVPPERTGEGTERERTGTEHPSSELVEEKEKKFSPHSDLEFPFNIFEKLPEDGFDPPNILGWVMEQKPALVQLAWDKTNRQIQDKGNIGSRHGYFVRVLTELVDKHGPA